MDDTTQCPICQNKFRNIKKNGPLHAIGKNGNYIERTCTGMNHSLQLFTNTRTKKVDFLKLSLNPKYSRFLEIDYHNQKCRIACYKDGKPEYLEIDKMLNPDFPDLIKLREIVALYILFS